MIENAFFMNVEKINKTFCKKGKKSFSVFGGASLNASEHTKFFCWAKCFIVFCP